MKTLLKSSLKTLLTRARATISLPLAKRRKGQLWIVMYHRVLPKDSEAYINEEPGMVVSPETLDMHFEEFKQHFNIIPLNDVLKLNQTDHLDNNYLAITFDDGWLDNYVYALPIINKHQLPVTLYAVTDMLGKPAVFWPNRISDLVQNQGLDHALTMFELEKTPEMTVNDPREQSAELIKQLKKRSDADIMRTLGHIKPTNSIQMNALMSWDQLAELHRNDLIQIGSHTCQHLRLNALLDKDLAFQEVRESQNKLENKLKTKIDHFCYPNGDATADVIQHVKSLYRTAVTTQHGINKLSEIEDSALTLKRIGLFEDVSDTQVKLRARLASY